MKLGLNDKLSNTEYHGDKGYISSSGIKLILKDEMEYLKKYVLGVKDEEINSNFVFGTYMHTAILEPHLIGEECAVFEGSTRRGNNWDSFSKEHNGKCIITRPESLTANKILEKYNLNKSAVDLFSGGEAEVTYCAILDGLPCKARADYIKGNCLVDLKTTSHELSYDSIQNTIFSYGYHISAAFYMDIINQYREEKLEHMFFVFASKKTHDIMVVKLSNEFICLGRKKYKEAIEKYFRLQKEGFFTIKNLDDMVMEIKLPEWAK